MVNDIIGYITHRVKKILRNRKVGDVLIRSNIKRICKEQGRSVSSVEHSIGISKGYVYNMKNPTIGLLRKIADELNVDVCELLTDWNEQESEANGKRSLHTE